MFVWMNNQNMSSNSSQTTAPRLLTPVIYSKNIHQNIPTDSTQEENHCKSNLSLTNLVSLIEETVSESVLSLSPYEVEVETPAASTAPRDKIYLSPHYEILPSSPISSNGEDSKSKSQSSCSSTTIASVNDKSPKVAQVKNVATGENEEMINSLTAINPHVMNELKAPWILAPDIESISCPVNLHQFRKAWWAGVRPTTCERTCRHRSKICDAIQLCNDCTGYYCKWLAELIGIPVLKANGRVDPLIFHKDPLAKLYWERISKVVCCTKSASKCLMCIRRYQLFTHFLPGNLLFRELVHKSVMRLHECGFSVDMGLIRKVTRRHLERISDTMNLKLPSEYYSSLQAYNIILQRGSLVDVLTNNLTSVLSMQRTSNDSHNAKTTNYRKSSNVNNGIGSPNKKTKQQSSTYLPSPSDYRQPKESLGQSMSTLDLFTCLNYDSNLDKNSEKTDFSQASIQELTYDPSDLVNISSIMHNSENTSFLDEKLSNENSYNEKKSNADEKYKLSPTKKSSSASLMNYSRANGRILRSNKKAASVESSDVNEEEIIMTDTKSVVRRKRTIRKPKMYLDYSVDQIDVLDEFNEQMEVNFSSKNAQKAKSKKICFPKQGKPASNNNFNKEKTEDQENLHSQVLEQVAAALLRRIGSGREKKSAMMQIYQNLIKESSSNNPTSSKLSVKDAYHTSQLIEENRLAKGGFRGVFWEPVREAWCTLLPLLPSDTVVSSKRRILSFSVQQWGSFQSAMWRAVYERVSRNIEELEYVNVSLLEELATWVKSTINSPENSADQLKHEFTEDQNNSVYSNATPSNMFVNFSKILTSYKPQEIV